MIRFPRITYHSGVLFISNIHRHDVAREIVVCDNGVPHVKLKFVLK
jgi:hypothetical protein